MISREFSKTSSQDFPPNHNTKTISFPQVALSQADNTQQFQQYLQTNQILTQVVSSSDQLQNIAAKPPANVQQKNVINISQLVTNMNTTGAKDETFEGDQLKNATVVHQGTQYVTTSVAGIHRLVQQVL